MADYQSQRVKVEGTTDYHIAMALAHLSGFSKGTGIKHRSPERSPAGYALSDRTVIVFHKDTIAKDPDMWSATQSPDILVTALSGDEYLIEFNKRIDPSNISKLEEEIRLAYSRQ